MEDECFKSQTWSLHSFLCLNGLCSATLLFLQKLNANYTFNSYQGTKGDIGPTGPVGPKGETVSIIYIKYSLKLSKYKNIVFGEYHCAQCANTLHLGSFSFARSCQSDQGNYLKYSGLTRL